MSRTLEDVKAVVLTHGHSDHIGFAEHVRDEQGVPVSVHELDAALAGGEVGDPSAGMGEHKLGSFLSFIPWASRRGAPRTTTLTGVSTFDEGTALPGTRAWPPPRKRREPPGPPTCHAPEPVPR